MEGWLLTRVVQNIYQRKLLVSSLHFFFGFDYIKFKITSFSLILVQFFLRRFVRHELLNLYLFARFHMFVQIIQINKSILGLIWWPSVKDTPWAWYMYGEIQSKKGISTLVKFHRTYQDLFWKQYTSSHTVVLLSENNFRFSASNKHDPPSKMQCHFLTQYWIRLRWLASLDASDAETICICNSFHHQTMQNRSLYP